MKLLQFATAALVALSVRSAAGQDQTLFPAPAVAEEVEGQRDETPSEDALQSQRMLAGSGIPSSPYPAGLAYTMTPQPFRVPFPDRIYYPPAHYVRLCPYFPKGVYWGADWNQRLLGRNPWLIHGNKRFNPYLTQAKIQHHAGKTRRSAPAPHFGPVPGGAVYHAPPLSEAKSSRRESKPVEIASAPAESSEPAESESKAKTETVRSTTPRRSQVKFAASPGSDAPLDAPVAHETEPTAKTAAQTATCAAGRTLPAWQRPPAVRR